jgi:O-succinylbenzoate synthase
MLESGVGAAICAALATLPGFTYPADIFPSGRFYERDLAAPDIILDNQCRLHLADIAGVGFEPAPARLEAVTVSQASIVS